MSQQKLPAVLQLQIADVRQKYWTAALYMRLANEAPADRKAWALNEAQEMRESYRASVRFARDIAENYSSQEAKEVDDDLSSLPHLPRNFVRATA